MSQTVLIKTPDEQIVLNTGGMPGPPGPPGPSGTMIVAVAYADWPPTNPQPNTLYLRLAP